MNDATTTVFYLLALVISVKIFCGLLIFSAAGIANLRKGWKDRP